MPRTCAHIIVLSLSTGCSLAPLAFAGPGEFSPLLQTTPEFRVDSTAAVLVAALVNYFCQVFPCETGSTLEAQMSSQSASWRAHGLPTGLSELQRAQACANARDARALILANPGMVSPQVESDYIDMLNDIILRWSVQS